MSQIAVTSTKGRVAPSIASSPLKPAHVDPQADGEYH